MPVKGSTSCDVNTSLGRTVTPSLSEKPPAVSNAVKPPSTQAEGGRPDVQRDPPASPSPPPLPRLNPLHITLLHLHALYAVRFALHAIRNSVTTALIANPLPPPFAPANASASFAKRIGRFHWRMSTISRRCGTGLLAWLVTMGGLLAFLVKASSISSGAQGWNVVACAGWVGQLRLADSLGAVKAGARGWAPLRNVVLIEIISNLLQAFLAIMPLLVSLGWAPSAISASFLLHSPGSPSSPPPAGSYRLPTDNFLSAIISPFATNLLTILQVLQLVLARSPSHRWFNFSTLIVLNAILLPLEQLAVMREKKANEAERIAKLAFAFPRRAARRGTASRDAELEGTCLVCFEGTFEPDATVGGARRVTFITACELPCGHTCAFSPSRYMLLLNLKPTSAENTQSTPPVSHAGSPSSRPVPPVTVLPSHLRRRPHRCDHVSVARASDAHVGQSLELAFAGGTSEMDEYPGAAAMRRREQRRAQAAL
ncbi:zinc finger, RING/FYVE/PHD-type domain containing protein [Rhodotorula toruloides]|uniref:Zinc finger, RING/FYVE/PHD-type domain containing protein n=1 Tax=Rhodotorula toruloides TaxID=5286 RepID=A0A511KIV0_RHOTO|nr:zinc finger, RING/FYVE/PHD-type domain containing protein [Rhodotorula toruloides]